MVFSFFPQIMDNRKEKKQKLDTDIIIPDNSIKSYRHIQLENGLDVLVVSDIGFSMAAAAMAVRVGTLSDPLEVQGLAHLLEHILPCGSKKFTSQTELSDFATKHGGSYNAVTHDDYSIYHFEVGAEHLKGALDRFAQMFVSPLLLVSSIENEIAAINSEFELYKSNDDYRLMQLQLHTSPAGHIFNRFPCGNKKSLLDNTKLEDLQQYLRNFFNKHYHSGSMVLTVVGGGGDSLFQLEKWVRKYFSGIKKLPKPEVPKPIPKLNAIDPIWNTDICYVLKAVNDNQSLHVSWMLPPQTENLWINKSEHYLLLVLGHEGKGSLFSFLNDKGWVCSLDALAEGVDSISIGRSVTISMVLTSSGLEEKYNIVRYIYDYISILRNTEPAEWVMREFFRMKEIHFHGLEDFGIARQPNVYAIFLAGNMLKYPLKHVISGDYLPASWSCNPQDIQNLIECLIPQNMSMFLISKSLKSTEIKTEPWFNSLYFEEIIPLDLKEQWTKTERTHDYMYLPKPNKFIPCDFKKREHYDIDPPKCLVDTSSMKMWWMCEGGWSSAYFHIYVKVGSDNVKNHLLVKLFIALLKDEIHETIFLGKKSGFETSLSVCQNNKVELKVYGYRDKLCIYLSKIWESFMYFLPATTKRFEIIKEILERDLNNNNMDIEDRADQLLVGMLSSRYEKILSVLKSISFDDLIAFIPGLRSQVFIEGVCFGDLLEGEAEEIANVFQDPSRIPLDKNDFSDRPVSLPCGQSIVSEIAKGKSETNSLAKVYYQILCKKGQEPREVAMLDLFSSAIHENLFHQLRTQEHIGYYVESGPDFKCGVGFEVTVSSSLYDPEHISRRICDFIGKYGTCLELLSDESFEELKRGVVAKLPTDSGLTIWQQIVRKSYILGFNLKKEDELRKISKEDLIQWYKQNFTTSSRIASILIRGSKIEEERES